MPRFRLSLTLTLVAVLSTLAWLLPNPPVQAQIQREDLRAGLVATYRDGTSEILQLDPAIALTLDAGEAPHPRLAGDKGTVRWEGYLNVFRPSDYKFSVLVRGKFRLSIDGKEILAADVPGEAPEKEGATVKLGAGVYPILAEFTRLPGPARLELFWQAPIFIKEPLPVANLKHLPDKAPPQLAKDRLAERGRFLFEEMSCIRCHVGNKNDKLAQGLEWRQAPDLSNIGSRYQAAWIYQWLQDPQAVSHDAVMPRLFANDETGQVELYAATRYLEALGGPLAGKQPKTDPNSIKRGKQLFTSVGCVACHPQGLQARDKNEAPLLYHLVGGNEPFRTFSLPDQGRKTTPDKLAAYLQNPHKTDPSGRMPSLLLDGKDAQDIANYLCLSATVGRPFELPAPPPMVMAHKVFQQLENDDSGRAAFAKMKEPQQWRALGERVIIARGCANCHNLEVGGKPMIARISDFDFGAISKPKAKGKGCLAADAKARGTAPHFAALARRTGQHDDLAAVAAFLASASHGAGSPSPVHKARVTLQRFNCLACHNRDGEGGLPEPIVLEMRKYQKAEDAETILPPTLSGIGHKLRTPWFRDVLVRGGKSRPWMNLRMPQFGEAHVGKLPEAIAALEGTVPDDKIHQVKLTAELIESGRQLIGKNKDGYSCISCHDIAGVPNSGTRGPDLAQTTQHVRYEWYRRWLESAQRMDPGTKMPSIILDGRTMLDVMGGNADAQAKAMWAYLSLGPTLALPEGVGPTKGLILTAKERPTLLRTFMQDAGTRAVTVGFLGGISTAFDATQCRLAYSWSGGFLDVTPVWANRGGAPAKILGPKFWTAPAGFPWALGEGKEPPDFAGQAINPAYGAALPEGNVFQGEKLLYFDGYGLDEGGVPTFHYRIKANGQQFVKISERPAPLRALQAVGIERQFKIEMPPQTPSLWLYAATVTDLDPKQTPSFAGKTGGKNEDKMVFSGPWLVLPQTGDRAMVLTAPQMPKGARWHVHKQGDSWKVYLEVSPSPGPVDLRVGIWSVSRYESSILPELMKAK